MPADFPAIEPKVVSETAPGFLFMNNYNGNPYILIFKNDGTPYFYRRVEDRSREFKVNPTGVLSRRVRGEVNGYQTLDSHYNTLHTWKCLHNYETDDHEFQMTVRGTAMMIGLMHENMDLRDTIEGGKEVADVLENVVQEIDENKNVVFEWRPRDHISILESEYQDLTGTYIDPVHINSIAEDYDGNIVISCRHLNQCIKIDKQTGEIIWRFGGKKNQFALLNDEGFSYQHDFRPVPGKPGNYTMFDNGNLKSPEPYSRAVEYKLDTVSMTAEKVWEYIPSPKIFTYWMGNVQRLPDGNTLINMADDNLPKVIEVNPDGDVVYQANFETPSQCYRTFRFEWQGTPDRPDLTVDPYSDQISLIFNKFGDERVKGYNVYFSKSPAFDNPVFIDRK